MKEDIFFHNVTKQYNQQHVLLVFGAVIPASCHQKVRRSPKQIKFSSNTSNRRDHHLKKNDSLPFVAKRFFHKMGEKKNKRDAHKSFFMCSILLTYSIDFKLQLWLLFLTSLMIGLRSKNKMGKKMEKNCTQKRGYPRALPLSTIHPFFVWTMTV